MITINNKPLAEYSTFPGGELHIKLPELGNIYNSTITVDYRSTNCHNFFALALIKNALDYKYGNPIFKNNFRLNIPYLPYARQDRICNPGEALSLEVAIKFIESLKFDSVNVVDVHSPIAINSASSYIFTFYNYVFSDKWNSDLFKILNLSDKYNLVLPDSGALTRYNNINMASYFPKLITCDKVRVNGKVSANIDHKYTESIVGQNLLIVDDICDGGATFLPIAQQLKQLGAKSIVLYVTHGIFSKGLDVLFNSGINTIITTNSLPIDNIKENFHILEI